MSNEESENERNGQRGLRGLGARGIWDAPNIPIDLNAPRTTVGRPDAPPKPGIMRVATDTKVRGYTAQITAQSVSALLLPSDPERKFLFIQNNDPVGYANIAFGVDATLNTGMRLTANGGGILLDNNVPTAAIYIIGSIAANSNITLISG